MISTKVRDMPSSVMCTSSNRAVEGEVMETVPDRRSEVVYVWDEVLPWSSLISTFGFPLLASFFNDAESVLVLMKDAS